ncbi:MAG: class I SAM-dependent methyltransferase [Spongiibacteraceae bacterium]
MLNLPNLSFMVRIGQVRAIQALYEAKEQRNPDYLASRILPISQRVGCFIRGRFFLKRMRGQPFYQYVLARTRYYDQIFSDAIAQQGVRYIVNIGCGGDTRAYRFLLQLSQNNVNVLECDQAEAIHVKQAVLHQQLGDNSHLEFQAIDLNNKEWPELAAWLEQRRDEKILVMLEGVSPYVNRSNFEAFLAFLFDRLKPGSRLAYDYKREGVVAEFGKSDRTLEPFRLRADADVSAKFHQQVGFEQQAFELSENLSERLAPGAKQGCAPFAEDCLIQLLRI